MTPLSHVAWQPLSHRLNRPTVMSPRDRTGAVRPRCRWPLGAVPRGFSQPRSHHPLARRDRQGHHHQRTGATLDSKGRSPRDVCTYQRGRCWRRRSKRRVVKTGNTKSLQAGHVKTKGSPLVGCFCSSPHHLPPPCVGSSLLLSPGVARLEVENCVVILLP